MLDESCRSCGGELFISGYRECKTPIERICKKCKKMVLFAHHYCISKIASLQYANAASA